MGCVSFTLPDIAFWAGIEPAISPCLIFYSTRHLNRLPTNSVSNHIPSILVYRMGAMIFNFYTGFRDKFPINNLARSISGLFLCTLKSSFSLTIMLKPMLISLGKFRICAVIALPICTDFVSPLAQILLISEHL